MAENMTPDDQNAQPVKTATDLALEKLTARLDALESENAELKEANKGLWAELHPVQPTAGRTAVAESETTPASGPTDYEVVVKNLGIKEE